MMKKRGLLLVVLSILMGVGAAWVANNWVQIRSGQMANANASEVAVVTAAMAIPYGLKVEERHLSTVMVPRALATTGVVMDPAEIVGSVSTSEIMAGEILMKSRFSSHEGGSTLASLIAENKRAITVRVDDVVGVAGFLLPGNYVDVLATRLERSSRTATTKTVLEKIRVLAVDQTARTDDNEPVVVRAVTLEMDPKESEVLTKSMAEGTIQLTLRNPADDEIMVAEEAPKPVPVQKVIVRRPAAPAAPTVTVIRGTETTTQNTRG
jgi:pilus assembly protein CpaB